MRNENQNIEIQTNNPIQYFQWKQKQKQTKSVSQCKWKLLLWTNQYKRNIKILTFNQSLILSQHDTVNSSNQREEKCQKGLRDESQVTKARTSLENLDQVQQAKESKNKQASNPNSQKDLNQPYWAIAKVRIWFQKFFKICPQASLGHSARN